MEKDLEKWKDIIGLEKFYEVSNMGRCRSKDRIVRHNYGGTAIKKGRLLKFNKTDGYLHSTFVDSVKNKKSVLLHRIVAENFIPNPDNKKCVNHKNGIKTDNYIDNLEWVTYLENQQHADNIGLRNICGERNGRAKLSLNDIVEIKKLIKTNTKKEISELYNVTVQNIHSIAKGKTWRF